jgi:hypothetical protein
MRIKAVWMIASVWIATVLLGGCAPPTDPLMAQNHTFPIEVGEIVRFTMPEGRVHFIGKADGAVEISGKAAGQLTWKELDTGVEITVEGQGKKGGQADAGLEIKIPEGVHLDVSTYEADILLENINGQVKAVSVAGEIIASQLSGDIFLKSGRGNVRAVDCEGQIRVLGEHGILRMTDLHGQIASATIMGTINFTGSIGDGDEVFLETDHGPVLVTVIAPVNMQVKAWTASGEVACMIAGLEQTIDGCVGRVGDGAPGKLTVKTVSGKIWMETAP